MISVGSARALAATGLVWEPARGDRFVIPDRGMDEDVFVLSDMTIEAHDHASGRVLGFNGTTEWALDSVAADDVLWLPGEGALRALLGPALVRLEPAGLAGWSVTVTGPHGPATVVHPDAEEAYALALLSVRATRDDELLPLAARTVVARTVELDELAAEAEPWGRPAEGVAGAGQTRAAVLEDLVMLLRREQALAEGEDAVAARRRERLVADADPVAEDRAGTVDRAVVSVLRALGAGGRREHPAAGRVLLALVRAAVALGADPDARSRSAAVALARAAGDRGALDVLVTG